MRSKKMMNESTVTPSNLLPDLQLLTPAIAARLLQSTEGTLAVWRSTKRYRLPFVKIGAKVFYKLSDVQQFIEERTHSGVSEVAAPRTKRRT